MAWTPDMDDIIIRDFKAGVSASASADKVAAFIGSKVTRNAVIGRWNRLGYTRQDVFGRPKGEPKRRHAAKPLAPIMRPTPRVSSTKVLQQRLTALQEISEKMKEVVEPVTVVAEPGEFLRVHLLDLPPQGCRWSVGEDEDGHQFCGLQREDGRPYCPQHVRKAYISSGSYKSKRYLPETAAKKIARAA
jgi:GcrA cell cycle regulator